MDELKADFPPTGSYRDFVVASRQDVTLTTVRKWVQSGAAPAWSECVGLSPELRCWRLQVGNLSVDMQGRCCCRAPPAMSSQLVVLASERQDLIRRFHDSGSKTPADYNKIPGPFGCFPDDLSPPGPGLLAGAASGCPLVSSLMCSLFGPEVSLPTAGSHGTCRGGPPMGSGGHGSAGHVGYDPDG